MVVSRKILSQWIDVKNIKDQEIVDALNSLGFEVDKVVNLTTVNSNLIVGEILKIEEHPKSKKLNLCSINIGSKILKIICGANNVKVGKKVVVAQLNSKLANGLVIDVREIIGVRSSGMLCSLTELGLNPEVLTIEELEGIVYLPDSAPIGSLNPLKYLELDDTIFEIQLTLNRSDCLAMYYLALELSHYFGVALKKIKVDNFKSIQKGQKNDLAFISSFSTLSINLLNHDQVAASWIKRTLQLTNIKPKSFFDDLVNIVMLELGQPVIVFASEQIKELNLDLANKDYLTKNFQFFKNDLVFKNQDQPFSNLSVSTLENYLVDKKTNKLIFVSLNLTNSLVQDQIRRNSFNPSNLLLQRLNKPIVPINYLFVLQRILFLLQQHHVKFEVVSFVNRVNYQPKNETYNLNYQMVNQLLGTNLAINDFIKILKIIDCQILKKSIVNKTLKIKIPNYRSDLHNLNDFAEEVARIIGYDKIPVTKPKFAITSAALTDLEILLANMRHYLLNYGFHQVKTYNLTHIDNLPYFNFFNYKKPVTLISPINESRKVMRFSLLASLLDVCCLNSRVKQNNLKVFTDEVIYTNNQNKDDCSSHHLAFVVNNDFFAFQNVGSTFASESNNYLLIKGFLEAWFSRYLGSEFNDNLTYQSFKAKKIHPYLSSEVRYNTVHFATIAALHPQVSKELDLSNNVFLVEINFTKLAEIFASLKSNQTLKFENWSKFNMLSRDLSFVVGSDFEFSNIKNAISTLKTKYLQNLTLIDIYLDEKLKAKKQHSLTFNLEFNSKEQQLDEEKISQEIKMIQEMLEQQFNAKIR